MADREPPNDVNAEAGLLAVFLHDKDGKIIDESLERGLKPSMFYDKKLRLIACACFELYSVGRGINKESVVDVLASRGKLDEVGKALIDKLDARNENAVRASYCIEIIKEKAFRRKLIKTAIKAVEANFHDKTTNQEIADAVAKMFLPLGKNITADDVAEAQACRKLVHDKVRALFDEAKEQGFNLRGTLRLLTRLVERLNKRARGE